MLRSRGISQIYHTYSEDMHPYILRYRGFIPLGVTTVVEDIWIGAYPPRRCGISYIKTLTLQSSHRRASHTHHLGVRGHRLTVYEVVLQVSPQQVQQVLNQVWSVRVRGNTYSLGNLFYRNCCRDFNLAHCIIEAIYGPCFSSRMEHFHAKAIANLNTLL